MSDANPWKTLASEKKYENPWIEVVEHQVVNPAGKPGIYGTIHFKNQAVAILPIADNGDTWLVGQYRYPLKAYSWEIPEGGCPSGETPLESAKRELEEEAGLTAKLWELILEMDLSNSACDERSYSYIATGIEVGDAHPEEDEVLRVERVPFKEVLRRIERGEIRDALTIATVLAAARRLGL